MSAPACARIRGLLPFYLEHEVGPAEALETAAHLAACDDCAAESARARRVLASLRAIPDPVPARDIAGGVLDRLRRLRRSAPDRRTLKWSALGVLGLLAVVDGFRPGSTLRVGFRLIRGLGELVDLDGIASRLLEMLPRALPTSSSLADAVLSGALPGSGAAIASPAVALALTAGAAVLLALLSALLLAGGWAAARRERTRRGASD